MVEYGSSRNKQKAAGHDYIFGIDIVRCCAALMVTFFHLTWRISDTYDYMPVGWVGVQIFFVISGVVIANSANGQSPVEFLIGRACRLYPCALIVLPISCLAIYFAEVPHVELGIDAKITLQSVAGSALLVGRHYLVGAYWTLPIEIAFYSVVFLFLVTDSLKRLPLLAAGLTIWSIPFLFLIFAELSGLLSTDYSGGYGLKHTLLMRHGHYFAIGLLIWLAHHRRLRPFEIATVVLAMFLAIGEISMRMWYIAPVFAQPSTLSSVDWVSEAVWANFLWFGAVAAIHYSMQLNSRIRLSPGFKTLTRYLGLVTFPVYLLHETVGGYILGIARGGFASGAPPVFIAVAAVIAVSFILVKYAEPPLRRFMNRWLWRLAAIIADRSQVFALLLRPADRLV